MIKRVLTLATALALLFTFLPVQAFGEAQAGTHRIEMRETPFYLETWIRSGRFGHDIPLYFVDGVNDLPYVDVIDWMDLLAGFYQILLNSQYDALKIYLNVDEAAGRLVYTRENGSTMVCDFRRGTLEWDDYDAFFQRTVGYYIDLADIPETDANGQPYLIQRIGSSDRHGEKVVVNLSDYGIPMFMQEGKYLIPLQTMSAFCLSGQNYKMYFNGEWLILANTDKMKKPATELMTALVNSGAMTEQMIQDISTKFDNEEEAQAYLLQEISKTETGQKIIAQYKEQFDRSAYMLFLSGQTGALSREAAQVGYNELCLELDSFYGLKKEHSIQNFDLLLSHNNLKEDLLSGDVAKADSALSRLLLVLLDDGHSGFISGPGAEGSQQPLKYGPSLQARAGARKQIASARAKYPEAQQYYYEVGNTAYVVLDNFSINMSVDYYSLMQTGQLPDDTVGRIVSAHQRITRENSPIENVVLDLSNNGGGSTAAAVYTISWFLGNGYASVANTFTGAQTTSAYRADINLDHQFDEKDMLQGRNLFCLISPVSFSCGNLVPWAFRQDGRVTLLGKTSGGGSCVVAFSNTAWGASFRYSSPWRMSFLKNGSFYDVDQGVVPDSFIQSYDNFYNRESLTNYINGLFCHGNIPAKAAPDGAAFAYRNGNHTRTEKNDVRMPFSLPAGDRDPGPDCSEKSGQKDCKTRKRTAKTVAMGTGLWYTYRNCRRNNKEEKLCFQI